MMLVFFFFFFFFCVNTSSTLNFFFFFFPLIIMPRYILNFCSRPSPGQPQCLYEKKKDSPQYPPSTHSNYNTSFLFIILSPFFFVIVNLFNYFISLSPSRFAIVIIKVFFFMPIASDSFTRAVYCYPRLLKTQS